MSKLNFNKLFIVFFQLFEFLFIVSRASTLPEVAIEQGVLQGTVRLDRKGNIYHSYKGIPYGKAPIGELRFKPPVAARKWEGVFNASDYGCICPQGNIGQEDEQVKQSEDCLNLNVFIPKFSNDAAPKAVLVYFFGGGFATGAATSSQLGPENLMPGDIILITINYRMGVLGFSAFDDPTVGVFGNQALKDTVLALKWVQKNIRAFGGDPKRVTIMGNSSGGCAVHGLTLSKLARGLFHRAILQSGTMYYFTRQIVTARQIAEHIAKKSNKTVTNDHEAIKVLNATNGQVMYQALKDMAPNGNHLDVLNPVVEHPLSPDPFFAEEPEKLMKSGDYYDVPVIIGYNNMEAIAMIENMDIHTYHYSENSQLYEHELGLQNFTRARENGLLDNVTKSILEYYYGNENYSNVYNYLHMASDIEFFQSIHQTVQDQFLNQKSNCFVYRFCMDTKVNYGKNLFNKTKFNGASHSDELGYFFQQHSVIYPKVYPGSVEDRGIDISVTLWSNFVKTANPNLPNNTLGFVWKSANANGQFSYLNMDIISESHDAPLPEQDRFTFWDNLRKRNAQLEQEWADTLGKNATTNNGVTNSEMAPSFGPKMWFAVIVGVLVVAFVIAGVIVCKARRRGTYERI